MGTRTRATVVRRAAAAVAVLCLLPVPASASHLPDVPNRHWAHGAISWVVGEGHLGLNGRGRFLPQNEIGRGPAVRSLWRAAGAPLGYVPHGLVDVGSPYDPAVRWAVAEGIASGFADRTFLPARPVTRGQYLTWLWKADGSPRQTAGTDGALVPYPASGVAGVPVGAGDWAVEEGIIASAPAAPFRARDTLRRAQLAQWLYQWDRLPPVELAARVVDANLVELHWKVRDSLASAALVANVESGLADEPDVDVVPANCAGGAWCQAQVRVGQAGWIRYTLTVPVPSGAQHQSSTEALVARLPSPVVDGNRLVVDRLAAGAQVLRWDPPSGVPATEPLDTHFVQITAPGRLLPMGTKFPVDGEFVVPPGQRAVDRPGTWSLRYCEKPQGGAGVLEDVVCSPAVEVTFDPEGAQFTGPFGDGIRHVVDVGDPIELTWSGPGDHWVVVAPTLLSEPVHLTDTSLEISDVPEGFHALALVSCAGPCPVDVSGMERERLQIVAGLDERLPAWTTRSIDEDFTVERVDTLERSSTGSPLDLTFDDDGDVWMIGEFGADLAHVEGLNDLGGPGLTHHETPHARANGRAVGPFANPFHDEDSGPVCGRATFSALGERVIVTDDHVWFTHGGALGPLAPCVSRNHSRLVRFEPGSTDDPTTRGDDRFCAVHVPGQNSQVIGIAHDPATDRIWFTEPGGTGGPALSWFDEEDIACHNELDYADPTAVDEASSASLCSVTDARTDCIHRIPLGPLSAVGIAPAHLAVDPASGHVWISDYGGRSLSRFPLSGVGGLEEFPMPPPSGGFFNGFPWQIRLGADAVYLVEYSDNQVVRFDTTLPVTGCEALVDGENPCMREVFLPMAADTLNAHSIDLDGDRLWFTVANEARGVEDLEDAYLGYLDLSTWGPDSAPSGVLYEDLGALGAPPASDHRSPRGIDVEPTTGRVALAEMGREIVVLTPH